jgi:hypothetical protein
VNYSAGYAFQVDFDGESAFFSLPGVTIVRAKHGKWARLTVRKRRDPICVLHNYES